ncbi:hypothetical protein Hanom_Chr17g01592011 [Helianthus anomalus]
MFGVDPSTTGPTQVPTTNRAHTWPGQHVDPRREAGTRYHHKNAREQPCQRSWRSDVVWWCYEESRENRRTGPADPWARIHIILSQDHRRVVPWRS